MPVPFFILPFAGQGKITLPNMFGQQKILGTICSHFKDSRIAPIAAMHALAKAMSNKGIHFHNEVRFLTNVAVVYSPKGRISKGNADPLSKMDGTLLVADQDFTSNSGPLCTAVSFSEVAHSYSLEKTEFAGNVITVFAPDPGFPSALFLRNAVVEPATVSIVSMSEDAPSRFVISFSGHEGDISIALDKPNDFRFAPLVFVLSSSYPRGNLIFCPRFNLNSPMTLLLTQNLKGGMDRLFSKIANLNEVMLYAIADALGLRNPKHI